MSRRRQLLRRRDQLAEIRGILESMKTLSFLETRNLGRFLAARRAVVDAIETMAADLLSFHPGLLPERRAGTAVVVVIGAERGFCGDLNRALLDAVDAFAAEEVGGPARLLAVGRKLHALVGSDARVAARIPGASVAEEIPAVLDALGDEIAALGRAVGPLDVYGAHHGADAGAGVDIRGLLPPFRDLPAAPADHALAPVLHLPPETLLTEITDRYLLASLSTMLNEALMAEHQSRIGHLGGAVRHLDEQVGELAKRGNVLRQEEIIEEIEVIMLSAGGSPRAERAP